MELTVHTDFPGGNGIIHRANRMDDGEEIRFSAETKQGEPQALWFYFKVKGCRGPRIRCILTNASQTLGGVHGWAKNAPVYRIGNGDWHRVSNVQLVTNEHLIPEVKFDIYTNEGPVEIAFCYPYIADDVEKTMNSQKQFAQAVIGQSVDGKDLRRLYSNLGDPKRLKKGIYLLARQHSGETPGSWVLDGAIRYLADKGKHMSEELCWWIVPFADIDGVQNGYYGKDQTTGDLNRSWQVPFPKRPEIKAIQHDMKIWSEQCVPFAVIDLHAPGHAERGFYYWIPVVDVPANKLEAMEHFATQYYQSVPEHLRGETAYRHINKNSCSQSGARASGFVVESIRALSATLEISYQGAGNAFYSIEDYHTLGRVLVDVLYESAMKD